jgi:hypothetical protein
VTRKLFYSVFLNGVVVAICLFSTLPVAGIQSTNRSTTSEQSSPQVHRPNSSSTTRAEELRLVIEEDAELDYLYSVHEVDSADYLLTKGRHFVLKRYLQSLPDDMMDVPELYVVTRAELKNFFRTPPNPERLRNGARLEEHWVYHGKMTRNHVFYIFERQ